MTVKNDVVMNFDRLRSILFVPGDRPDRFEKAMESAADAVCFDLEDAVALEKKHFAREKVKDFFGSRPNKNRIIVRINSLRGREGVQDLSVLAGMEEAIGGIIVPKVEGPEDLAFAEYIPPGSNLLRMPLVGLIESAKGLRRAQELAQPGHIKALALGAVDLALELGATFTPDILMSLRLTLRLACAEAGIAAIDGPFLDISDVVGLEQDLFWAEGLGFSGKLAIHPRQVAPINRSFSPSKEQREWATNILERAGRTGAQTFLFDGKMVDRPLLEKARRILEKV